MTIVPHFTSALIVHTSCDITITKQIMTLVVMSHVESSSIGTPPPCIHERDESGMHTND